MVKLTQTFDVSKYTVVSIEQLRKEVHERNVFHKAIKTAQGVLRIDGIRAKSADEKRCIKELRKIFFDDKELAKLMGDEQDG